MPGDVLRQPKGHGGRKHPYDRQPRERTGQRVRVRGQRRPVRLVGRQREDRKGRLAGGVQQQPEKAAHRALRLDRHGLTGQPAPMLQEGDLGRQRGQQIRRVFPFHPCGRDRPVDDPDSDHGGLAGCARHDDFRGDLAVAGGGLLDQNGPLVAVSGVHPGAPAQRRPGSVQEVPVPQRLAGQAAVDGALHPVQHDVAAAPRRAATRV